MKETATILIALKLENEDVLNRKLLSGDIEDLVALTLLNTAYHSRNFPGGLLLASHKTLSADNCPPKGRPLFDKVMTLKDKINRALATPGYKAEDEQECEDARTACKWINDIKNGRLVTPADRSDATEHELAVVNDIIRDIASLKTLGMQALPVTPEAAAASVSSVGRRP